MNIIRGIGKVVPQREIKPGGFYLGQFSFDENVVFQCVANENALSGKDSNLALYLTRDGRPDLFVGGLPSIEVLVELPDVFIRVDPPSLSGTNYSKSIESGMLLVSGGQAIVTAGTGRSYGWTAVSISEGRIAKSKALDHWATFDRWSLIYDDSIGEIEIASFGSVDK